mmetsp:Transcript_35080/g.85997  ORF Transcript_35080/g.85997 Transcript_35080/m.85997 type:complete len:206 (+) Transcript_35080:596-1213(+)
MSRRPPAATASTSNPQPGLGRSTSRLGPCPSTTSPSTSPPNTPGPRSPRPSPPSPSTSTGGGAKKCITRVAGRLLWLYIWGLEAPSSLVRTHDFEPVPLVLDLLPCEATIARRGQHLVVHDCEGGLRVAGVGLGGVGGVGVGLGGVGGGEWIELVVVVVVIIHVVLLTQGMGGQGITAALLILLRTHGISEISYFIVEDGGGGVE